MPAHHQPCSKYESIVKKAKERRSNKDKLSTSSNDASYSSLQKRRKPNLSQSFIMRQTVALSAKNKQLVNALTQTKSQNAELEINMRKMQEKLMMLIMKLNSREVALDSCVQELETAKKNLQSKDEMYTSLYNQIHQILNIVPKPNESMGCTNTTEYTPVDFSFQPKRVPKGKSGLSVTPKQRKWKPDLSIVQEKLQEDSVVEVLQDMETTPLCQTENTPDFNSNIEVEVPCLVIPEQSEYFASSTVEKSQFDDELAGKMRRTRRRTSIFSISSFDPDDLSFNVSDNDEDYKREKETDDETRIEEIDLEKRVGELEKKEIESKSDAFREVVTELMIKTPAVFEEDDKEKKKLDVEKLRDFDLETIDKENKEPPFDATKSANEVAKVIKKPMPKRSLKKRSKNFSNTSFGDATTKSPDRNTLHSNQLADPVGNNIVVEKLVKKKGTLKPRVSKSKPKVNFREESAPQDKDVYNCSSDSFLINPDKKIELSKEICSTKSKSLPMTNITNEVNDITSSTQRNRRRTAACLSYKEPSINKKLRRGDKFFVVK